LQPTEGIQSRVESLDLSQSPSPEMEKERVRDDDVNRMACWNVSLLCGTEWYVERIVRTHPEPTVVARQVRAYEPATSLLRACSESATSLLRACYETCVAIAIAIAVAVALALAGTAGGRLEPGDDSTRVVRDRTIREKTFK